MLRGSAGNPVGRFWAGLSQAMTDRIIPIAGSIPPNFIFLDLFFE
jgi:hypothetical protein